MRTEPDNCTPRPRPRPLPARASIAPSSPASRPFVLAALRALRLDPGCGCRTPQTRRKRPEKRSQRPQPRLDQFRRFRDDPGDLDGPHSAHSAGRPSACPTRARRTRPNKLQDHHKQSLYGFRGLPLCAVGIAVRSRMAICWGFSDRRSEPNCGRCGQRQSGPVGGGLKQV